MVKRVVAVFLVVATVQAQLSLPSVGTWMVKGGIVWDAALLGNAIPNDSITNWWSLPPLGVATNVASKSPKYSNSPAPHVWFDGVDDVYTITYPKSETNTPFLGFTVWSVFSSSKSNVAVAAAGPMLVGNVPISDFSGFTITVPHAREDYVDDFGAKPGVTTTFRKYYTGLSSLSAMSASNVWPGWVFGVMIYALSNRHQVWINGQCRASGPGKYAVFDYPRATLPAWIGGYPPSPGSYSFSGGIAVVGYAPRVLTTNEMSALWLFYKRRYAL